MNLLSNVKLFSSFSNIVNALSSAITVIKIITGLLLAVQLVMVLVQSKSKPLKEVIKL